MLVIIKVRLAIPQTVSKRVLKHLTVNGLLVSSAALSLSVLKPSYFLVPFFSTLKRSPKNNLLKNRNNGPISLS